MASARDLIVVDEKGDEILEFDPANIDQALAGVSTQAPLGWTAAECYEVWKSYISGYNPFEIDRNRKAVGKTGGLKSIVVAIRFIRYKVGLTIDPQVEQHKLVSHTRALISGLSDRLNESMKIIQAIDKAKKDYEEQGLDSIPSEKLAKYATFLELRQKEMRVITSLTSEIKSHKAQLADLTGAHIMAKKTAAKQKGRTITEKLNDTDDAALDKLIEDLQAPSTEPLFLSDAN
jgi:hypothetical protein